MKGYVSKICLSRRLFDLYKEANKSPRSNDAISEKMLRIVESVDPNSAEDAEIIARYQHLIDLILAQRDQGHRTHTPRQSKAPPVILTTINPFSRLDIQLRCFTRWRELGFEVYSCNSGSEIQTLIHHGVPADVIIKLDLEETGEALFGKPTPRVMAVLERARQLFEADILLVNSDLYPVASDTSFVEEWRAFGKVVALTRTEVVSIDHPVARLSHPYHGGLDAFLVSRDMTGELIGQLSLFEVSKRMSFGIPGWDYLVGAVIQNRLNGTFVNSRVLLHEMHQPAYSAIDEFSVYTEALHALNVGAGMDHVGLARHIAEGIRRVCTFNDAGRDDASRTTLQSSADPVPEADRLIAQIEQFVPLLLATLGRPYLTEIISAVRNRPDLSFSHLSSQITDPEPKRSFANLLLMAAIFMDLRGLAQQRYRYRYRYPERNHHAAALREKMDHAGKNPDILRLEIAKLFCTEFLDFKIINPRLFNFIALSCENDTERTLVGVIRHCIDGGPQDAA